MFAGRTGPAARAARRLALVVPTVLGILAISFLLIHLAPGDPVLALAGEHGDQAYYDDMRARFGLDRPLLEQALVYVGRVVAGDLGSSWVQGRPAVDVIAERVPATLLLMLAALAMSTLLGGVLGVVGALRRGSLVDFGITALALVLYSTPVFLVGQLALVLFVLVLPIAPVFGTAAGGGAPGTLAGVGETLRHLALPAAVLAAPQLAAMARLTRSSLLGELAQPYVRTARAKGLGRAGVLRHAGRLTLLPIVTMLGMRIGQVLGGAVIVESIFGWPGLGTLLLDATSNRDGPVLLGIFLGVTFAVVIANALTDLSWGWIDPRFRTPGAAAPTAALREAP